MNLRRFVAEQLGLREEVARVEAVERLVSRRKLLFGASLLGGALAAPRAAKAAPPTSHTRWLVNRLTFGWTPEEQLLADTLGYHGYLEYHLNHEAIDDSDLNQRLSTYETLSWLPYQVNSLQHGSYARFQLQEAVLLRATFSKRQLFERMGEFWSDHFHSYILTFAGTRMKPTEERLIRGAAFTSYPQLLNISAHSSAMLHYLTNDLSVAEHPNENYARELMELHTLGVNGGYTFQDIQEVARCFTGWTYHPRIPGDPKSYLFKFEPSIHDFGSKTVLGHPIPAGGGESDGLTVLNILANHPSTAQFVSRKLCRRFFAYDPPQTLVDAVAATFTATGGDVKSMLRTLFTAVSPSLSTPKVKRPLHYFASCLRVVPPLLSVNGQNPSDDLREMLTIAGHLPFEWPAPDGYPDTQGAWSAALLPRINFPGGLVTGDINRLGVDFTQLLNGATTAEQIVEIFNARLFGGQLNPQDRQDIVNFMLPNPVTLWKAREALGLALSTPAFQWY